MKCEPDPDRTPSATSEDTRPYVGRFLRRQGNYGTILVVARGGSGVELLDETKRLFLKDGIVETQGVAHAGLVPGDWAEFDLVRNSRPRAPQYKTTHLRRLPRYAVLPESTPAGYRTMLTKVGWRGERRAGLWALRMSGDRVLVVDLVVGADGALRIPRRATGEVRWCAYRDDLVTTIPIEGGNEEVFLGDNSAPSGAFDWSDESDYVAQVIRSLADANDPRVADLITWLELHHEEGTGRVFAATLDHDAAEAALRSGELAERLRADRDLMNAYLDAVVEDDRVRQSVADWAREGHGEEAGRLRKELAHEIEQKRAEADVEIAVQTEAKRNEEFAKVKAEAEQLAQTLTAQIEANVASLEASHADRLKALQGEFERRCEELEQEAAKLEDGLQSARGEIEAAEEQLGQIRSEEVGARAQLVAIGNEVDRLLAISVRLEEQERMPMRGAQVSASGVRYIFEDQPHATATKKGLLIGKQALLTDHGKQLMRQLATLMLAGELPLLTGSDAQGLLKIAEALLCPRRSASIEADATIISVDDLWSRPGSGAPTALAAAAKAAEEGGGTLVTIRRIEQSGARIWYPALADCLRNRSLPRGLLVACLVDDVAHEEMEALPRDIHVIAVENALTESAYLAGVALLSPPALELETLAPGEGRSDLSSANALLATLGFKPPLDLSFRIARIYVEALGLLGDEMAARSVAHEIASSIADRAGLRAE